VADANLQVADANLRKDDVASLVTGCDRERPHMSNPRGLVFQKPWNSHTKSLNQVEFFKILKLIILFFLFF